MPGSQVQEIPLDQSLHHALLREGSELSNCGGVNPYHSRPFAESILSTIDDSG
jgi:hypothetical protein